MFRLLLALLFATLPFATQAQFWVKHTINQDSYDLEWLIDSGDFNGDGAADFVTASHSMGHIWWWENNGDGTGAVQREVGDVPIIATAVRVADLDTDGDDDILVSFPYDQYAFYENIQGTGLLWAEHYILSGLVWSASEFDLVDMDDDGDIDIIGTRDIYTGGLAWWENAGDGLTWDEHLIATAGSGSPRQFVADFDSDGDLDLFGVEPIGHNVQWWENLDGNGLVWSDPTQIVYENPLVDAKMADLDGDGDTDLVTVDYFNGYDSELIVWSNDGAQNLTEHVIASRLPYAFCIDLADMDVDGDLDFVIICRQGGVYWWENRGGLEFVNRGMIAPGVSPRYDSYTIADFSQDGIPDYLAANSIRATLVWWQQMEQPGSLTLTRTSDPVIPSNGGTVIFDASCESFQPYSYAGVNFWTSILQPDGSTIEPAYSQTFNMPPFFTTTVTGMTQEIPSDAPAGDYTLTGHIGYYPASYIADTITFSKSATGSAGPAHNSWQSSGGFFVAETDEVSTLPEAFSLSPAYPNPFNPVARVSVQLPESANLCVKVYDITGRLVATLANETRSAGTHTFTIDGSGLASGVYFVRAASGTQSATQKLVLMK